MGMARQILTIVKSQTKTDAMTLRVLHRMCRLLMWLR